MPCLLSPDNALERRLQLQPLALVIIQRFCNATLRNLLGFALPKVAVIAVRTMRLLSVQSSLYRLKHARLLIDALNDVLAPRVSLGDIYGRRYIVSSHQYLALNPLSQSYKPSLHRR